MAIFSVQGFSFLFHPSSNGEFARWGYVVMNARGMRMGEDSESESGVSR